MAETLGSLVDKLTIKQIRQYHLQEMLDKKDTKFSIKELKQKMQVLEEQKGQMLKEIDSFVKDACSGNIPLRDEKIKLYNAVSEIGAIPQDKSIAKAIEGLAQKNLELWHLEDEARRKDVALEYIGTVKQKIDKTNQQRNDFIDKIDELFDADIRGNILKKGKR